MNVPVIALTFWKPSTVLIVRGQARGDPRRAGVDDVDRLVVDGVDRAEAGDADEDAAVTVGLDRRGLAARVVEQRVDAAGAVGVDEVWSIPRMPIPTTLVVSMPGLPL